jgi:nickel-type superoxide dismutase maturation protease
VRFPAGIFKVKDKSMEPGLVSGDFLFVTSACGKPKVGDIVVLKHPSKSIYIVKRVSAINGCEVFVIGDNKDQSEDSRDFGSIDVRSIMGKVVFKI